MPLPNVKALCGAHSRRTGEPCRNPAMAWTGRCRMHGGTCDRFGSANVSYRHGQYCRLSVDKLLGGGTIALFNLWHDPAANWNPPKRIRQYADCSLWLTANAPGGFAWAHEVDANRLTRQEREREQRRADALMGVVPVPRLRSWRRPSWRDRITLSTVTEYRKEDRPRCGATTKGHGDPCRLPVVAFRDRCKWHGGCSTGPKTQEGKKVIAEAQRLRWARYREQKQAASEQGVLRGEFH
jgi:hypothetical protein